MRSDDLATVLAGRDQAAVTLATGTVREWNTSTGANVVDVAGTLLANVPFLATPTGGVPQFAPGHVVALLRWRSGYYVLGRIRTPS